MLAQHFRNLYLHDCTENSFNGSPDLLRWDGSSKREPNCWIKFT
jgi:hypothetical protein